MCVCVCVCVFSEMSGESQTEEVGLKQAHHDIHWIFLAAHQDPSAAIWRKSPAAAARKLDYSQQVAPKAGVSEPITAQTGPSPDNHGFARVFDSFVQAFKRF